MTATITPHNARNLARTDPAARLKDYDDALGFYLGLIDRPLHGIVFVENSDSDVTTLRQLVASRGLTGGSSSCATTGFTFIQKRVAPTVSSSCWITP